MADRRGEPTTGKPTRRESGGSDMEETRRYRMDLPRRSSRGDTERRAGGAVRRAGDGPRGAAASSARQAGASRPAVQRGATRAAPTNPRTRSSALARLEADDVRTRRRGPGRRAGTAGRGGPRATRRSAGKRGGKGDRLSFLLTLIVVVLAAVCLGYLIGQYMYDMVMNPDTPAVVQSTGSSGAGTGAGAGGGAGAPDADFRIQVGAFSGRTNATELSEQLRGAGYRVRVTDGPPFRVQIEVSGSREDAENLVGRLQAEFPGAFIL